MNAIKLLKKQHKDVKKLMQQAEKAEDASTRRELAMEVCDQLTVHATIEEKMFYPASMNEKNEDLLREAVEEHLGVKRVLADLMSCDAADPQYKAKITVLKEEVGHHVEEEEETLFPRVEKMLGEAVLKELGARMEEMTEALLAKGNPRKSVPSETSGPAPLPEPGDVASVKPAKSAKRSTRGTEARR